LILANDSTGKELKRKLFGVDSWDTFESIVYNKGGGFVMVGNSQSDDFREIK
jgi:hypothetical protein